MPRRRQPASNQTAYTTIEISGHKGHGSSFDVEVEFSVSPVVAATYMQPAEGGEVEIVRIRVLDPEKDTRGRAQYRAAPEWLISLIEECVDVVKIGEDAEPDDDREEERGER